MATYYKYAERSVDSMVNWAEIGKNITDMLGEENRIREEKKAAIDQATREFGKKLAEAPQGENRDVNKWTLNYADDATQAMLLQDRLLKSGRTKLKDYNINRQNLVDGTNVLFNLSKEYQDEYKIKMERMKSTDPATRSQAIEDWLMGSVEGFSNFSQSKPLINPTDYTVNVGMMKKNPQTGVMELTDDVASVNSLRNRIKSKFDYFDVDNANVGIAGKLAEFVKAEIKAGSSMKTGFILSLEDAMKRPGYEKAMNEAINSMLVSPFNISSILTENIGVDQKTGKAFSFTFNEKEAKANPNLILMKTENDMPVPQFTEDQRNAAASFMKGQIEQMIKYDQKINPYAEPRPEPKQEWQFRATQERNSQLDNVSAWNGIFTAKTPAEKNANAQAILSSEWAQGKGLLDLDFTSQPGKILFIYDDPKKNVTMDFDPETTTLSDWSKKGVEAHGISDMRTLMSRSGGGNPNMRMTEGRENFSGVRASRQGTQDPGALLDSYLNAEFANPVTEMDTPYRSADKLTSKLGKLGYTVQGTTNPLTRTDVIKIKGPGQTEWTEFNLDKGNVDDAIKSFVQGSYSPTLVTRALSGGGVNYGNK